MPNFIIFYFFMYLKSLSLKNFRNYGEESFSFDSGINILTGENAQGKTNVAEAIFLLCTGYSPRASKNKLFIKNGCDRAEINGTASTAYGDMNVRIVFNKTENKNIYVNGLEVHKISSMLGVINSVFFNPAELKLVQEAPEDRRRFMNISLSQLSKSYFIALQKYNKIIAQRNNLLKEPSISLIRDTLPIWDAGLAKEASKIITMRNEFLSALSPIAEEKHAFLSGGKEKLKMSLESGYSGGEEEICSRVLTDLTKNVEKDIRLGFTTIGPHRDDIKFTLNDDDVRVFGSQGQQRTVALALKLAETDTFKGRTGEYPILILDDVLSELDSSRQKKLVSACKNVQTIFTTAKFERPLFKNVRYTKTIISAGKIKSSASFNTDLEKE